MKKRVCTLATVLLLMLSMTVQAAELRATQPYLSLSFSGTTATCTTTVRTGSSNDYISVTQQLWCGQSLVNSWSGSDYGSVSLHETCSVVRGSSYKLVVNATVAGTAIPQASVSGTCK